MDNVWRERFADWALLGLLFFLFSAGVFLLCGSLFFITSVTCEVAGICF